VKGGLELDLNAGKDGVRGEGRAKLDL
jgi:hypothetical protein